MSLILNFKLRSSTLPRLWSHTTSWMRRTVTNDASRVLFSLSPFYCSSIVHYIKLFVSNHISPVAQWFVECPCRRELACDLVKFPEFDSSSRTVFDLFSNRSYTICNRADGIELMEHMFYYMYVVGNRAYRLYALPKGGYTIDCMNLRSWADTCIQIRGARWSHSSRCRRSFITKERIQITTRRLEMSYNRGMWLVQCLLPPCSPLHSANLFCSFYSLLVRDL